LPTLFELGWGELSLKEIIFCTLVYLATSAFAIAGNSSPESTVLDDAAQSPSGIVRFPDVGTTNIVFVYAGDLWVVPRAGGTATRLTNTPGPKSYPKFSPDGQTIAFTGSYNGIYAIAAAGGVANRVTHNPGTTTLCSWTPDGQLLFMSDVSSHIFDGDDQARVRQLFTVPASGGLPHKLPIPYGANGAISPDGEWLAYTPYAEGQSEKRKHYFGGFAPDIWLFNLHSHQAKQITDWKGTDTRPMWHGGEIYYLSDAGAEGRLNIWSYDTKTSLRRQITHFADFDVKWASIGPGSNGHGEIVFVYGADLYLLDLGTKQSRQVNVSLPRDLREKQTLSVDASKSIVNWSVSPEGERSVIEARGDLWTVDPVKGPPRDLTRTSGVAERDPSWSPNGQWIAFFSDASGENELSVVPADGSAAPRQLTNLGAGFRYRPLWSPDSQRIAFYDSTGSIYLHALDTGETKTIDRDPLVRPPQMSWSPDSRWLAYARGANESPRYTAIWLYNLDDNRTHQVTSGSFNDSWPTFDRQGDYLFFVGARSFRSPTFDTVDYNDFVYQSTDLVLVVPLRADVTLPWVPKGAKSDDAAGREQQPLRIDLQDFERRARPAVRDRGKYSNLKVAHDGQLLFTFAALDGALSIKSINFKEGQQAKTVLDGLGDFRLSADGKKLVVRRETNLAVVDPVPDQKVDKQIKLEGMTVEIDPRAEGRQIFNDAWRLYRDVFYDRNMRGVNWPAMRVKYSKLLDACARPEDFYEVTGEMLGELGSSHLSLSPPRDEQLTPEDTGMLGVDFELQNGAYRIVKIYEGAPMDAFAHNSLRDAGTDVKEGEYLLAVNGTPMNIRQDPWVPFAGLAGKSARLTVSSKPVLDQDARQVTVSLLFWGTDTLLRNRSWIEANRVYVERQSGGKVGYIYLPDTHEYGSREFTRQFNSQLGKEALIIDGRWNEGGHLPLHIIEVLSRQRYVYSYDMRRGAGGGRIPDYMHDGPKCLIINGVAYSGGDELPYFFRKRGLGKLIGTRTMGGMVGIGGVIIPLIDGGSSWVPHVGFYDDMGNWTVEGQGVEPDIKVIDDPSLMTNGGDPQLDTAIQLMLKEIKTSRAAPQLRAP